ncbi:MAG: FimV/HubP family polar landmark protein, partial [Herbaspirillum sp.]
VVERSTNNGSAESKKIDEYHVKKGDSLAGIARQVKPSGVSLDQMLVALYQHNPDAFIDHNMNRMRAGRILSIPAATAVAAIAPSEARSTVVAQTKDFNQYRNRLAGQVADSAASKSTSTSQSASGKITSTVEESNTAVATSKDKLKLSKAGASDVKATGPASATAANSATHTEDLIAKDKALAEANARVSSLEKSVADLQKLLELKNSSLAQAQAGQAAVAAPAAAAVATATETKPTPATTSATTTPAPAAADAKSESSPATADVTAPPAASETSAAAPVTEPAPTVAPVVATPAKPVVKTPPPAPVAEPSFVESLAQNTLLLPGMGLLLVALGAFGIYNSRRKKKQKQFTDSLLDDTSLKSNSLFGSTGGQSVDTNNSVFNSSLQPSASQLDTNEVDPIAEADVYIAYGRDAQAEEILKEALRTQPERNPVRVKLLEIYANRKDLRAFELQAGELYSLTKGTGDDWAQAANLGRSIDASNPLYAGGKLDSAVIDKVASITAPTEPLEELDLDALLATTQPHPLLDADDLETNSAQQLADLSADPDTVMNTVAGAQSHGDTVGSATTVAATASALTDLDFDLGDFGAEAHPVESAPV